MYKISHVAGIVLLLVSGLITQAAMAAGELVLGVQDYGKSPRMMALEFRDMSRYLSAKMGQPVVVEPVQSYQRYMERARQKRYDFMYGPPTMVMEANALAGYEPVAKVPGLLSAAFMSLADGPIAFPEDMKGKRIGMPEENSMMTMLAFAKLREMKVDPRKYFSNVMVFNDANDVISALKLRMIDVGVANSGLYNVWSAQGHNLNLVLQSSGAPHLTFAVRGDLPAETKKRLKDALLNAHKDAGMANGYFKRTGFPNFEAASLADYEGVKKLLADSKK
ncbi:MAG: PhnD/SsuA/transferrin family substrate-binding protein [Pseudomonadota bacterium]